MNIQDASSVLFGYFIKNDSITNEDFIKIAPKKVSSLESEAAFSWALSEMEAKNLVVKFISTNTDGKAIFSWTLRQPLISNKQTLELDGSTAISIAGIVNDFYSQINNKDSFCNPLQITQNDIQILMEIITMLAEGQVEQVEVENKVNKK